MTRPAVLRCAIYTRKSSDEGLEQSFNSLDAQREACEAYIRSQVGEGWKALPTHYDDGGFSGGSMERPGLKQLIADIAARRIDIVVVYKVDRLTRSLGDFARIVEVLDRNEASFVSVTQAFNTTTSMGRLTLNVLLSFAQFEREVTGERIRDKIAMSKARGMWMGGTVPLGYDLYERNLAINATEAELVRHIFRRYLELGSVHRLRDELEATGVRSKSWTARTGRVMGGAIFNRGGIFHVLRNRLYLGEIVHKDQRHPGLHRPIVDTELFDAVQARLDDQASGHRKGSARTASAALTGRIFDAHGEPMSPSFSYGKQSRRYRYYISQALQLGRRPDASDVVRRINADAVERFLATTLSRLAGRTVLTTDLRHVVARLELRQDETHVVVDGVALMPERHAATVMEAIERRLGAGEVVVRENAAALRIILPARLKLRGGRVWIAGPRSSSRPEANPGIVEALRSSHQELLELDASPLTPPADLANARSPLTNHRRQLARLPFLAPDLQRMVLEGRQPEFMTLRELLKTELPLAWADQRALLSNHQDARSTP